MSGTGPFRSGTSGAHAAASRNGASRSPAEEHLGDRLAAFVDGELPDDTRERVQAHLATCDQCKAEADEQRRLKSAVADTMPPALSAGLLARLQGLPGGGPGGPGGDGGPFGGSVFDGELISAQPEFGVPGEADEPDEYGSGSVLGAFGRRAGAKPFLMPSGATALPTSGTRPDGFRFRIHDVGRSSSRGRRFAFAAAGAFSLAAIALGGALPLDAAVEGGGTADAGTGSAVTPLKAGSGQGPTSPLSAPAGGTAPLSASEPLLLPQGGRAPARPTAAETGAVPPTMAPLVSALASTTPEAVPQPPAPLTARSVAPSPLPLLGTAPAR